MLKIEWSEIIDFFSCTISFKIHIPQLFIYLFIYFFVYRFIHSFINLNIISFTSPLISIIHIFPFLCVLNFISFPLSPHLYFLSLIFLPLFRFLYFLTFFSSPLFPFLYFLTSFPLFSHLYSFLHFFLHNYSWLAASIGSWDAYETRTETNHPLIALYTWW